jgi:hypothetical protein
VGDRVFSTLACTKGSSKYKNLKLKKEEKGKELTACGRSYIALTDHVSVTGRNLPVTPIL